MATRIVDVDGFGLVTGHTAGAELRCSATSTPVAVRSQFAAPTLAASAAVAATASSERVVTATSSTTATVTAAASVASPTDISSLLAVNVGSGTYGPGWITVPGYDQAYKVTVSNANIVGYSASDPAPGIRVYMPAPTTPNSPHWITIQWTINNRTRRVFHDIRTNWLVNGDVIEPSSTIGSVATLSYTWDTSAHGWYVSAYSGDTSVRIHGPDESSTVVPLYFTPECRDRVDFATVKSQQVDGLTAIPSGMAAALAARGHFVDIMEDSTRLLQSIHAREIFDPAWDSGASGIYVDPTVNAAPYAGGINGRTMLHELGHAWDKWGLADSGHTWGVDPYQDYDSPNAYDTVTVYYPATTDIYYQFVYTPTLVTFVVYDPDGNETSSGSYARADYAYFSDEQPIRDLYATVPDKPGSYYRSTITEWTAQCFMLCWADHIPGIAAGATASLITEVGGSSILDDFRDYAVTTGVLPSTW